MDAETLYNSLPVEVREQYEQIYDKDKLIEVLRRLVAVMEKMIPVIKSLAKSVYELSKAIINTYPNKRVVHLARHGKPRVRKKNMRRIMKWLEKQKDNDEAEDE